MKGIGGNAKDADVADAMGASGAAYPKPEHGRDVLVSKLEALRRARITKARVHLILITGAGGFVGSALVARASQDPGRVRAATRGSAIARSEKAEYVLVANMTASTDWTHAVRGASVVVHAAARAHVMRDSAADPLSEYRRVNLAGTTALARQAADAGVRRFVFLSSIKVNGEGTRLGCPYTVDDAPAPVDPYGVSKLEAENELRSLARESGLELVVVRPVLVYGPGVKGNFLTMMRWLQKGIPLPLGAVNNRRSLVALDNLVDLIMTCTSHPAAPGQTFLVSDGEDLSTSELLRRMAVALGVPARLVPFPTGLLRTAARLLGRGAVAQRLCGSLQVDISATRDTLGWSPRIGVDEGLARAAGPLLSARWERKA